MVYDFCQHIVANISHTLGAELTKEPRGFGLDGTEAKFATLLVVVKVSPEKKRAENFDGEENEIFGRGGELLPPQSCDSEPEFRRPMPRFSKVSSFSDGTFGPGELFLSQFFLRARRERRQNDPNLFSFPEFPTNPSLGSIEHEKKQRSPPDPPRWPPKSWPLSLSRFDARIFFQPRENMKEF